MKNIIDTEVGKFPLMKILKRHYSMDMMLSLLFDSRGVVIQGYNTEEVQILANTIIPIRSTYVRRAYR